MKKRHSLLVGIVVLAVALFAAYFAVVANAGLTPAPAGNATVWPKNANGVTYGSGLDAMSLEDEPDLIRVEATNGKVGYAYRTDLEGPEPTSPAVAVARQEAKGGRPDVISVYEVDGTTQIGVFLIENNEPKYDQPE